jgi:hypothetical protein
VEVELEQTFETFRSLLSLVVTVFTVLVTADGALVGYAVTNRAAMLVGVGAVFPLSGCILLLSTGRIVAMAVDTGVSIERGSLDNKDRFFWSLTASITPTFLSKIKAITLIEELEARERELRLGAIVPAFFPRLLLVLALLQLLATPVLWLVFSWPLL